MPCQQRLGQQGVKRRDGVQIAGANELSQLAVHRYVCGTAALDVSCRSSTHREAASDDAWKTGRKQIARFGEAALIAAEPGQVCGSAQFRRVYRSVGHTPILCIDTGGVSLFFEVLAAVAYRCCWRSHPAHLKSGSQQTPSWREKDSNPWSLC